jgi:DNA-binding NarL/FixJ family response regulator
MGENNEGLQKVLTALLLLQMSDLSEGDQIELLIRSGWTNGEIAKVCNVTENAVAIRKTRFRKSQK